MLLLLLTASVRAQQQTETRHELWPELDIYVPLKEKFRLSFRVSEQKSSETNGSFEGQFGVHVDYFWKKKWTLRAGYRYGFSLGSNSPFKEHRPLLEETFQKPLERGFVFTDRNRQEFRWINGDFSMRFRNRATLERDFAIGKRSLVPYGSAEIFYDTRFNTFNRYRLALGTRIRFKKRELGRTNLRRQNVLDLYYLWQGDSRSQPRHVDALGITFGIYF